VRTLVLVGVAVLALVGASLSAIRRHRRRLGIAAFAEKFEFDYRPHDPFSLLWDYNFPLMEMGDGRGCENVVWGEWKGLPFKAADYWYYEEPSNRKGSVRHYRHFNALIVDVPLYLPRVTVDREGIASLLAGGIGWRDIQFESGEFNKQFRVRAEDAEFAFKLIDARMMHWMLSTDDTFGFQFYASAILVWSRRLRPTELLPLIGTAKELHDHIPRLVWKEYTTETPHSTKMNQ
jgi:hypothetical protein